MNYMTSQRRIMRSMTSIAAAAGALTVAGCGNIDVENLNGVSTQGLQLSPTPTAVISASQGLMATWRLTSTGDAQTLTKYGFEIWQIRASNPPSLTSVVLFPQTGGFWSYTGVNNITVLLKALDVVAGMSD